MTRAARFCVVALFAGVLSAFSGAATASDSSTACEADPSGVDCTLQEMEACGSPITVDGTDVYIDPNPGFPIGCRIKVLRDTYCPWGSTCRETLQSLPNACDELEEVCSNLPPIVTTIRDALDQVICGDAPPPCL